MPLTDPIGEPLIEKQESLIPGLAPTKPPLLPGIQTSKPLLYQASAESSESEQLNLNLIEPASEPASEFRQTETDAFIINKPSDINTISSANTSLLITNSTLRDTTNSEVDPLIGKLDSDLGDPLINPNRIPSNNVSSDSNKSATDIAPVNSSISNSEINKTTAATTAVPDELLENKTQLSPTASTKSEQDSDKTLPVVTASTTSEKASDKTPLPATAETTSKPEEHQTPLSSETTLKSESSPNKISSATASTSDNSGANTTSPATASAAENPEPDRTLPATSTTDKSEAEQTLPATSTTDKSEAEQTSPATVSTTDKSEAEQTLPATSTTDKSEAEQTLPVTTSTSEPSEPDKTSPTTASASNKSESNKTSVATASTPDKSESNKTSPTEISTTNNLETATNLEPNKTSTPEPDQTSTSPTNVNFDSNAFTVDEKGIVGIQFTSDGGWYSGQLAIVSLLGMEKFVPGSEAFIKEAASRALSNSTKGYIAISDDLEGAYYTDPNSSENLNSGQYLGTKTFAMTPGDKFFFMLVPNGTVKEVYDNPAIGGDKKPLFSIATDNPSDGAPIGQIADLTGEGKLFVMEDMGVREGSDRDYNDIIFKITGATSKIASINQFIDSEHKAATLELAQKLIGVDSKAETKTDSIIDNAPSSETKTDSVIDDVPSSESKTDSVIVTTSNESPKDDSVIDNAPSSEPKTDPVIDDASSSEPKTDPVIDDASSSEPKTDPVIDNAPSSEPKTDPVIDNAPSSEPKTDPVSAESDEQSPPKTEPIDAGASLETEPTNSDNSQLPQTELTPDVDVKKPQTTSIIVNDTAPQEIIEILPVAAEITEQTVAPTDLVVPIFGEKLPEKTDSNVSLIVEKRSQETDSLAPGLVEEAPQETDSLVPSLVEEAPQETDSLVPGLVEEAPQETDSLVPGLVEEAPQETDSLVPGLVEQLPSSNTELPAAAAAEQLSKQTDFLAVVSVADALKDIAVTFTTEFETPSNSLPPKSADTPSNSLPPKSADTPSNPLLLVTEETAQNPQKQADNQPVATQPAGKERSNPNEVTNPSIAATTSTQTPGTFIVGETGEIKINYLYDGGAYQGELGIFSLTGMSALTPGSPEFIAEAFLRVLSNSTDGHIAISDSTESAKFSGAMPGDGDWGSGEYQNIKTFNMTPGDTFAVMLIPNSSVQQAYDDLQQGTTSSESRPLFSIAPANPNDTEYMLSLADATGTGNTFALEDISGEYSDSDYNDLIFTVIGATGNAPNLDTLINPDREWRNTTLGQQLLNDVNNSNSDNNPPVVSPTSARTYTELETTISLENLATDAEGDPLTISVLNPVNGTVIFNPSTNKASFKPATGFSGIASFDFLASDAFGSSTPARVTVNVSDVPLLNLDFVKRNPSLNAGENTELIVLGDFADQKGVVLPDSYLTYTSINPEVAPIDAAGKVTGLTNGTSILSASRNNLQAVTPIRIGTMPAPTTDAQLHQILAEMYGLDPYPDAVSLTPGATRKLSLGLNSNFTEANLTAASTGTRYFSNNSNILNVSPDGTITAVGIGDATVTAIHGTAQATIPVRVEVPQIGPTALGTDGGIVNSSDGTLAVMIPPGALEQNATVSIAPVNQQNLSLPLPAGFEFAAAFNLNFGDNSLNIPAQLAIPAPEGLAPGTVAYFLRKGAIPDSTGTWNPIWLQEESGIVGDDGFIRTQSPPYPGVVRPGEYAVVYSSPTGSATLVKGQLTLNYNFPLAFFGIIDPQGNLGQLIDPDKFVTTPAFTVTRDISSVQVVAIPKVGLPVVTEVGVQRNDDGTATFKAALNMPAPTTSDPTTPPVLQKAELKFKDDAGQPFENNEPLLFLTGGNILVNNASDSKGSKFEDVTVKFSVGNSVYEGTVVPTRSRSLGGNQYEVAVKVPDTVVLGASGVVLERKQNQIVEQNGTAPVYKPIEYNSNPIRLPQGAEYVFAALGGSDRVAVLNGKNPESVVDTTNSKDLLLAQIPVGTSSVTDWAESTAVTSDGNRVYATLRNSGQVALVDPMVLRQVDTQPNTPGVNPIVLPAGARPKSIVISPRDDYAYIGDLNQAKIYVLDINPNSATYHKVVETINVTSPLGLSQLAISSDGRRLFGTGSDNNEQVPNRRIYAINIDSKDRPKDEDSNPRKWHQQIGVIPTISETEGISATNEPTKMVFTNGLNLINTDQNDGPGFGVLEITSDDPLNFTASVSYAPLSLGFPTDYFDVNEGVSVTVTRDGRYGFVAGRNSGSLGPNADVRSGGNIGIIKDPLGPNPQLIGATRPIPEALTNDLVLSNDNKYLYGSYPSLTGSGSVYAFDVEEMIKTLDNPGQFKIDSLDRGVKSPFFNATTARSVTAVDFTRVPIDDINPAVSIAADYGILQENRPANQFTYGVPLGTKRAPVGTGGNLRDLSAAPTDWLDLKGPGATTIDLTPTFQWQFAPSWEDVKEVNLFVSTFEQGEGLLPWDKVVDLSDSALLPGFSETQKRQLLSKPWNGYDDFNPNRILTATWKKDTGKWYGHDGITPLDQPLNDPANTSTNFTLPRSLTAGQNYNFAVEAVSNSGAVTKDLGQFKTIPPVSNSPFSSVSVLTHGFTLLPNQSGIPDSFFQMANKIATVSGNTPEDSGLIMRYDKPTGNWIPIDLQGRVITDLTGGLETSNANYLSTLANNLKAGIVIDGKEIKYLNKNKPLVLLPEWSLDRESVIPDVGFSEGAADALFASMVQLDLALGGKVGEYENNQLTRLYDSQGKLIRQQGDLFNSPMHFMGFSRGTVVNSEIVQRLGTFFPQAGGTSMADRDLQMTTIDPHDFYQPSLNLQLPGFISTNFSDFYEPKVQVWNNVTFADNYYQTVANPNSGTATPNGRALGLLPQEELDKNPQPAGLNFPKVNGDTLGKADREILLGTREGEPGRENSRIGFTKDDVIAGTHKRAFGWYAGTVDLDLEEVLLQYPHVEASEKPQAVNDMLGKMGLPEMFDPNFPAAKPWYDNGNGEGVGEGWFYSVLGGGKEQRTLSSIGRVPVSFDNTLSAGMRGDYAVPTLFNGNFDQFIPNKSAAETLGRNTISKEIPGWSLHNGATSTLVSPINNLVEWSQIAQQSPNFSNYLSLLGMNSQAQNYQPNYALKLGSGESITHNRFVVPDWGVLRLDIHVPESSLNKGGKLKVYLEEVGSPENVKIGEISLEESEPTTEKATRTSLREREPDGSRKTYEVNIPSNYGYDKDTIGYGSSGFETFHIDVPPSLRGKVAKLTFELQGEEPVYIDNAFFKSEVLKWGNPTEARNDLQFENNFLIEKPQYTLSYNRSKNTVNWVGWKLDKTWLGDINRPQFFGFAQEPELVKTGWYSVKDSDYDALYLKDKDGQVVDNRKGDRYADGYVDFEIDENGNYIPILGIDRGHMAPAADRNRTAKDLYATFLTTNLLPQESSNNQGIWKTIENQVRAVIRNSPDSSGLETYMFAGGYGYYDNPSQRPYTGISQNSNLDPLIQFPVGLWKVVMTKDKNTELPQYAHYGIYLGNDARSEYQKQSIQNLEDLLNGDLPGISPQYQFLSNLPESPGKERIKNTIFERLP